MNIIEEASRFDGLLNQARINITSELNIAEKALEDIKIMLEEARAEKDLRENASYQAAKEAMVKAEVTVRTFRKKKEILDSSNLRNYKPDGFVGLGTTVILAKIERGVEVDRRVIRLVSKEVSDAEQGLTSVESPVGKALEGREPGVTVQVHSNSKILIYKIEEVY